MAKQSKLAALFTSCELEEEEALREKKRIEDIAEERRSGLDALMIKRDSLLDKQRFLRENERPRALRQNDIARVKSLSLYVERLEKELEDLRRAIEAREQELERALERASLADDEVVRARIEKKRVEKLLANREDRERAVGAAVEQALLDELSTYRRGR